MNQDNPQNQNLEYPNNRSGQDPLLWISFCQCGCINATITYWCMKLQLRVALVFGLRP